MSTEKLRRLERVSWQRSSRVPLPRLTGFVAHPRDLPRIELSSRLTRRGDRVANRARWVRESTSFKNTGGIILPHHSLMNGISSRPVVHTPRPGRISLAPTLGNY